MPTYAHPEYVKITENTVRAYVAAQLAATHLAECLAGTSTLGLHAVQQAEGELDRLDREIDSLITSAIVQATAEEARELLSSMKMVIDLERVADLFHSVARCAHALGTRISVDDIRDLVKMASIIEKMLSDAHGAFAVRNADRAFAVIRADSEVDRLRNMMMIRHIEQTGTTSTHNSVQVLFMAQAMERAGDHTKNLVEEICHLITGQTIRHASLGEPKPHEQMPIAHGLHRSGLALAIPTPLSASKTED